MEEKKRKTGGQGSRRAKNFRGELTKFGFTKTKARERQGIPYALGFTVLLVALIKYSF